MTLPDLSSGRRSPQCATTGPSPPSTSPHPVRQRSKRADIDLKGGTPPHALCPFSKGTPHVTGTTSRKAVSTERLAARYIDADLVFSDTHAWTYLRLPTTSYEFLSYGARQSMAQRIHLALGALVTGNESVDTHLLITSRPVNEDYWAHDLQKRVAGWVPAPGWDRYRDQMIEHLKSVEFLRKEVYLGVCLGSRKGKGAPKGQSLDLFGPLKRMAGRVEELLDLEDDVVSRDELDYFRTKAKDVQRSLAQSHIRATPAHPNAVAWLITKPLHPDMVNPAPTASPNRVWGPGEIEALAEGVITNGPRFLEVEQFEEASNEAVKGYTATLCLSRFPDVLLFPDQEPWMHFASSLAFPLDISSRMTLVPSSKVQKDVGRKLADAKDQATHIAETGAMVPLEVQEAYEKATSLEYTITKDRLPWAYGRHRLTVTASTPQDLHDRVRKVIEHYRDLSIDVVWPTGDQMDLLREAMPGEKVRAKAYFQRQELLAIAGAMPTASSEVGDRIDADRQGLDRFVHRRDDQPGPQQGVLLHARGHGPERVARRSHHRRPRWRQVVPGVHPRLPGRHAGRVDDLHRPEG